MDDGLLQRIDEAKKMIGTFNGRTTADMWYDVGTHKEIPTLAPPTRKEPPWRTGESKRRDITISGSL